jgi:hypothetical protein
LLTTGYFIIIIIIRIFSRLKLSRYIVIIIIIVIIVFIDELNDLHSSPNIVRAIKSRRMRWAGHVARMGYGRGVYRVLVGKPEGKKPFGDPGVDGRRVDKELRISPFGTTKRCLN